MLLCSDPKAQYLSHAEEIHAAIERVLNSGWYILGEEVSAFEGEFAAFHGVAHGIGVANGTDALAIALKAVGVEPGDEVITVSHSAVATVSAIEQIAAVPVFCDIDPTTYCMNPERLPELIGPRTKAIVPVHIYGQPAAMNSICQTARNNNLRIVEDCAQAHGASLDGRLVGTFGDIAAFSFYPTKNLGALGDGGGIITADAAYAERARQLRQYGWRERYVSNIPGTNSRLDELQAAILRVKLPYLRSDNERRRAIATRYSQAFTGSDITTPHQQAGQTHAMHLYVIALDNRESLRTYLSENGIQAALHYPLAIHQQPAYRTRSLKGANQLVETERFYQRLLSLPMYPELSDENVSKVIECVQSWMRYNLR